MQLQTGLVQKKKNSNMEALKSPCLDCIVHKRELDKTDPRYPCERCRDRLEYAARVKGIPARVVDGENYEVHGDGLGLFSEFDDGLKISDISILG